MKKRKIRVYLFTLLATILLAGCNDDEHDFDHIPVVGKARLYTESGEVYSGNISTLSAYLVAVDGSHAASQNITVNVSGGETTINLPATPPKEALIDGLGWSQEGSGINMAHYSFERLGIGQAYGSATHLDLYWAERAIDGEHPLRAGWTWVDDKFNCYASLEAALAAGNKLYICEQPVTFTVEQVGGASYSANSESLNLTFSGEVSGLTGEHVYLTAKAGDEDPETEEDANMDDSGYALISSVGGSGKVWNATLEEVTTEGEVQISIDKFGVSRTPVTTEVYCMPVQQANVDYASWMSGLDRKLSICKIAIPGTHDSGSYSPWLGGGARCQNRTIRQQLRDGIRHLDLRVGWNGRIYHGDFDCGVTLYEIVEECINFLNVHDKETILVTLQWEGVKGNVWKVEDFQRWCAPAFQGRRWDYWYLSKDIPTLEKAQKKMVLINSDDTGQTGLAYDFCGQNDWDPGNGWQNWRIRADLKVKLIVDNRNQTIAKCKQHEVMHRNCWNKQFNVGVSVKTYANYINNKMKNTIWYYPRGIQSMDFYDQENVRRVIVSNF